VRGRQAQGDRRAVRRDEGAGRGLLDLAGALEGRGDRVGTAYSQLGLRPWRRGRDPSGVRGGGLRSRLHRRDGGEGRRSAREDRTEVAEIVDAGGADPPGAGRPETRGAREAKLL